MESDRRQTYEAIAAVVKKGAASNVSLSRKDADIPDYIMAPASKGEKVSQFTKDLTEIYRDPDKLVLLAKLIKSKLDLKDIETSIKTTTVRETKKNLISGAKTFSSSGKRSVADFL
jgi:hypothetical protein